MAKKKKKNNTQPASKKTTISLAINEKVLKEIKKDAEHEGRPLSAKVNDILTKHIVVYRFARDIKSIILSGKTFQLIVDQMDENLLLEDFMANAVDYVSTFFYAKNIPFTLDNIIKYAFEGPGLHGGIYHHFHWYKEDKSDFTCLVFRHPYGTKWSKVLGIGLSHLLKSTLNKTVTFTVLPSSVTIKLL